MKGLDDKITTLEQDGKTPQAILLYPEIGGPKPGDGHQGGGRATTPESPQELETALLRCVTRHPSDEHLARLEEVHKKLADILLPASDSSINWVISGSAWGARGGFRNAQDVRDFLTNPQSSSRLATGLETLLCGIGYCSIGRGEPEAIPVELKDFFEKFVEPNKAAFIGDRAGRIPQREGDFWDAWHNKGAPYTELSMEIKAPDAVSQASDMPYTYKHNNTLPNQQFRTQIDSSTQTWIGTAKDSSVPVRAHVSGTVPLEMAALNAVLQKDGNSPAWSQNVDELKQFAIGLFGPTYERGDYHTLAETVYGIDHYLDSKSAKPTKASPRPDECYREGIQTLKDVVQPRISGLYESAKAEQVKQMKADKIRSWMEEVAKSSESVRSSHVAPLSGSVSLPKGKVKRGGRT